MIDTVIPLVFLVETLYKHPAFLAIVGITASLIGFLIKDIYVSNKAKVSNLETKESKDIANLTEKLEIYKNENNKELNRIESKINDIHIRILDKLDEIKDNFNELRK